VICDIFLGVKFILTKRSDLFYTMLLLLAAMIWGSTFVITKMAAGSLPTAIILAIRFTVGAISIAIFCGKNLAKIDLAYLKWGMLLGIITFFSYGVHIFGLELDTTPGKSAFLTAIYCVLVPFVYWLFRQGRPDVYNFGAAFLCLIGIGLVSLTDGLTILRGDIYTLLGGIAGAIEIVLVAMACKRRDPLLMTCLQLIFVAIFSWILVFLQGFVPDSYVMNDIWGIVYLGLFATAGCLALQSIGLTYTNPSSAAIILSLESVFGVLFSVYFYDEVITLKMLMGFSLIFMAVIISQTKLKFLKKSQPIEIHRIG